MLYRRLVSGLNDKGKLIEHDKNPLDLITNIEKDHYISIFKYNEEHKDVFQTNGTIAGITDVTTDKLVWDFDNEFEPEDAKNQSIILVERLISKGIDKRDIVISFSGLKGFCIEINLNTEISIKDLKNIAFDLASDLGKSFDTKIYNASRVLRVITTRHQKSGLYKTPISFDQLKTLSIDEVMNLAKNEPIFNEQEFRWNRVDLPQSLLKAKSIEITKEKVKPLLPELDYTTKAKFLTNCRFSLQSGYFEEGDRSTALLCLASTYKNLGFDLEIVYRMLKGTAELQSRIHNCERFPDEEIYNNIILQVFASTWKNGQYSCREKNSWLQTYCTNLDHPCNHKEQDELNPKTFLDLKDDFKHYVQNIDKNTIHTGLPTIDKNVFLSTGANVGIVGASGSGKTSIALEILENTSRAGVRSVVASLDMAKNRIFEKVLYRLTGLGRKDVYKLFQDNKEQEVLKVVKEAYDNVNFFKKSSPTVQDIKEYVLKCNEQHEDKIKLVVIDYFERISSDFGDDTAASKKVAGELQDLVDELDICLITLLQPNKNALSGGPDSPIYDYSKIKGSSFLFQSLRVIMSCWRPFYSPKDFSNDKFMQMAVLKNDLGELNEFSFNWQGSRGKISEMEDFQRTEFEALIKEKSEKNDKSSGLNF